MSTVSSLGSSQVSSEISQVETRLQAPITNLDNQVTGDKAEISAWGASSGAMSTLSNSLAGISDLGSINNRAVTSSTNAVATATAAIGAPIDTFNLTNVVLAKAQEIYSALQGSAGAPGKTEQVAVGSGSLTLSGAAAAINKVGGGVQANVVSTSAGARLVFQSSSTGSSQAFSVAGTGALAKFSYSPGSSGSEKLGQSAANAILNINGVPVTSSTNQLGSAVSGLTISLAGSGNTTLSVSSSMSGLSAAVSSVASNLNAALSMIAKETAYVPPSSSSASSTTKSGPLLGNFTATNLQNQLLTAVSAAAASGLSAAAIGFKVSSAGAVSFDSTSFSAAYVKNPAAVQALITQIYQSLDNVSTGAIGTTSGATHSSGSVGAQTTSLQGMITSLENQVTQISKSNNDQLQTLIQQYTVAESASTAEQVAQSYLSIFTNSASGTGNG